MISFMSKFVNILYVFYYKNSFQLPEFRYVENDRGVQPSKLSRHALPKDIVDISTGEDSFKLVDLLKLVCEY